MFKIMLLSTVLLYMPKAIASCELKNSFGIQKHYTCNLQGKNVHFLDIHGDMKDLAFYHGKFLSQEIKEGILPAAIKRKDESFAKLSNKERKQLKTIYKCIMKRYEFSVGKKFIRELETMAKGADVSKKDVVEATLMVEMSGFIDSLEVKMEKSKSKAMLELFTQCGMELTGAKLKSTAKRTIKKIARPFRKLKRGCTGFVAGGEMTEKGEHLHGRNFDTGFLGVFEKFPVIVRHTPRNGYAYMGMSSAGLHYAGGITGMNEKGISISTHELRTTKTRTMWNSLNRPGVVAPYLANMVLKEANSLDDAIKLIKKHGHFGAWTFLISDSKTGEAVSVEMSGAIVRVAKREKNRMAQANHFLHRDTAKYNFEYSINKSLESRARISYVEDYLSANKGAMNSRLGIELLSSHEDYFQGTRSFGRTVSKVYTSMSHVMDTKNNEFWFSIGETYPTNFSTFQGVKIDFKTKGQFFELLDQVSPQQALRAELPFYEELLRNYTYAYFAHEKGELKMAYEFLTNDLNFFDFPTSIMKVRVGLKEYLQTQDESLLDEVEEEINIIFIDHFEGLHIYEKSQVLRDKAIIFDLRGRREMARTFFQNAHVMASKLRAEFPRHHFLNKYLNELQSLKRTGFSRTDISTLELHFATAE